MQKFVTEVEVLMQGGGILNFTAMVICGNGDGVAGFGKGKSAEISSAVDKVCIPECFCNIIRLFLHLIFLSVALFFLI
jgi:ribosomal protein S5